MTNRRVLGLADVVASGDRRRSLEALRDHLAQELENAPAGLAIGPIANQLRVVLAELDTLPDATKESTVDDLAKRRATRRATPAGVNVSTGDVIVGPGGV